MPDETVQTVNEELEVTEAEKPKSLGKSGALRRAAGRIIMIGCCNVQPSPVCAFGWRV